MADPTPTAAPPACPLVRALLVALSREEDEQTRAWIAALLAGDAAERGLDSFPKESLGKEDPQNCGSSATRHDSTH